MSFLFSLILSSLFFHFDSRPLRSSIQRFDGEKKKRLKTSGNGRYAAAFTLCQATSSRRTRWPKGRRRDGQGTASFVLRPSSPVALGCIGKGVPCKAGLEDKEIWMVSFRLYASHSPFDFLYFSFFVFPFFRLSLFPLLCLSLSFVFSPFFVFRPPLPQFYLFFIL